MRQKPHRAKCATGTPLEQNLHGLANLLEALVMVMLGLEALVSCLCVKVGMRELLHTLLYARPELLARLLVALVDLVAGALPDLIGFFCGKGDCEKAQTENGGNGLHPKSFKDYCEFAKVIHKVRSYALDTRTTASACLPSAISGNKKNDRKIESPVGHTAGGRTNDSLTPMAQEGGRKVKRKTTKIKSLWHFVLSRALTALTLTYCSTSNIALKT